jgi:cytochrome P450
VLSRPQLFSSRLGAPQIRDPATPQALGYVRQMMLNMDPPDHSRLRRLLSRSFTPRAVVSRLEHRIRGHARAICDRVFTGPRGECDFAKDVAADLPLLTLADVLGVPQQDRWLLFDWSNRVIGYQDPDYASSAEFDPAEGTPMARQALALRPVPGSDGRMPDPRIREGMPDLYAYAHLLAEEKRRCAAQGRGQPGQLPWLCGHDSRASRQTRSWASDSRIGDLLRRLHGHPGRQPR